MQQNQNKIINADMKIIVEIEALSGRIIRVTDVHGDALRTQTLENATSRQTAIRIRQQARVVAKAARAAFTEIRAVRLTVETVGLAPEKYTRKEPDTLILSETD